MDTWGQQSYNNKVYFDVLLSLLGLSDIEVNHFYFKQLYDFNNLVF